MLFQFHNGTIKSCGDQGDEGLFVSFQFHNGTIKSLPLTSKNRKSCYFNSTMVQLRELNAITSTRSHTIFQFHNGTIKRFIYLGGWHLLRGISIPQWYN